MSNAVSVVDVKQRLAPRNPKDIHTYFSKYILLLSLGALDVTLAPILD